MKTSKNRGTYYSPFTDKGGAGMILNRGPPSGFETSNKISNSGGTDMYIEHPYFYEGKYYAKLFDFSN